MNQLDEIGRLISGSRQLYEQWTKARGINYNTLAVLYGVLHYPDCTQKNICENWGLPKQTVFSVCRQLAQQGRLKFAPDPNDKRGKTLHLTEDGLAFAQPIIDQIRTVETAVIGAFGEQEMTELIRQLQRFTDIVARHTQEP
ncbi:MarR family winged helix-turn-helix transcriptional regulator [Neisseria sp. CCUG12390]|uniref:MarR family winged helix-turn-helix transcriptional regulator n=1 Tax=Neisseria sp. CCUG12390 TaxID=3392035 RepID=UPI003A0FE8D5